MGFGYLFIGSLIFCNPLYASYTFPISAFFMLCGLWMLSRYNRGFKMAKTTLLIWLIPAILTLVCDLLSSLSVDIAPLNSLSIPAKVAGYGLEMLFMLFTLTGIQMIATETALPKLIRRAKVWRTVSVVYYTLIFISVSAFGSTEHGKLLVPILFILGLVFKIAVTSLIWSCYMWICLEGDEDMPIKPMRFEWMNTLRDKFNDVALTPKNQPDKKQTKNKGGKGK